MRFPLILSLMAALVWTALPARAQVVVSKSSSAKVGVDVSALTLEGGAAIAFRNTLVNDLNRSGWMQVAPAGRGAITLRGSVADRAGSLTFAGSATDASGRAFLNGSYSLPSPQAVLLAHQVANDIVVKTTGKPTFFLARLAMIGVSGNAKELYTSDSSAQLRHQVTRDRSIALKPRWSPDNRLISYTSYLHRYPDIYTIDILSGVRSRVAAYAGVNSGGAISPDGSSMALILSKDGNPDLYVQNLATKRLTRLTSTPRAVEGSPAWSPDGRQIVYVSDSSGTPQLYILNRSGGAPLRLTSSGSQNVAPDWGSNGLIACQTLSGGLFQIAVIDPATKQSRIITPRDAAYEDPSWAPDGRHLAASRAVNYAYSLVLLDTMGDPPVPLTSSGDWRAPAWSH